MKQTIFCISLCAAALPAVAAWTVTTEGVPNGCTHVITDGNWKIGVYRYSDDNWNLGQRSGNNGTSYVAGSGDLDLTGVAADCGVILKTSSNGALNGVEDEDMHCSRDARSGGLLPCHGRCGLHGGSRGEGDFPVLCWVSLTFWRGKWYYTGESEAGRGGIAACGVRLFVVWRYK